MVTFDFNHYQQFLEAFHNQNNFKMKDLCVKT